MTEPSHAHLTRQLDIIPVNTLGEPITIIGAGAVGSFTCLQLAKMGFEDITVFDHDTIDIENMNCQFYRLSDIGKPKVTALQEQIRDFTGVEIKAHHERYEKGRFRGVLISAVDSMKSRKLIWDNHKEVSTGTRLLIDPRMGAEDATCYAMKPCLQQDIESYEKTLYTDEEAMQERCTAKSTMYCCTMLSGHVTQLVADFVKDQPYARTMQWSIKGHTQQIWPNKKPETK